ncbi:hypothetical protein ACFX2J_035146 [Malus domestica]
MDSPQSVVFPFKSSVAKPEKQFIRTNRPASNATDANIARNSENFIGVLEVYVHQARDIQNICIYHKQDVHAKLCLTSDPKNTVSTKTINGGGQNPVFDDNGQELSSRSVAGVFFDAFVGAGFVQSSLSYTGDMPEVMSLASNPIVHDSETAESCELDRLEFPDSNIDNEDQIMVSEYIKILCSEFESQNSDSFVTADTETQVISELGVHAVEGFSTATVESTPVRKLDSPPSSVSTNGVSSPSGRTSSESYDVPSAVKSRNHEQVLAAVKHHEQLHLLETSHKPVVAGKSRLTSSTTKQPQPHWCMLHLRRLHPCSAPCKFPQLTGFSPSSSPAPFSSSLQNPSALSSHPLPIT